MSLRLLTLLKFRRKQKALTALDLSPFNGKQVKLFGDFGDTVFRIVGLLYHDKQDSSYSICDGASLCSFRAENVKEFKKAGEEIYITLQQPILSN